MPAFDFPFVGAGAASYFEWAEMFVCFTRPPSKAEAAAIGKRVPAPLRDTMTWEGPLLWVASEQGVGRIIRAAYGKTARTPSALTSRSRHAVAPTSAYGRFDADIEAWLVEANATIPILVAYRREDAEAGGTALSDWHHASVRAVPGILRALQTVAAPHAGHLGVALTHAAAKAKVKVLASVAAKFAKRKAAVDAAEAPEVDWEARERTAADALGKPQPAFAKRRPAADLAPALAKLEKVMPKTARRLARMAASSGLAVRPGASASAIAAAEKAIGTKLTAEHRALLQAFDGGSIGDLVVLGTAAKGDAGLVTFTAAWHGPDTDGTANGGVVAHVRRVQVVETPAGNGGVYFIEGTLGGGGGRILRKGKDLDTLLDFVLKGRKS